MPKDYRYAICFRVILDFLSFEELPAMFTSCTEVHGALKSYTGIVMERWQFGKRAKHIMKKDVFEWYVARLGSMWSFCVFGAPPIQVAITTMAFLKLACGTTTFLSCKCCCKSVPAIWSLTSCNV